MANKSTAVIILILIGACGYNWVQIRALQSQVASLQSQLASATTVKHVIVESDGAPAATGDGVDTEEVAVDRWNSLAEKHYFMGRKELSQSDPAGAAKEFAAYFEDKRNALRIEKQEAEQSVATLQHLVGESSDSGSTSSGSRTTLP